MTIQDPAAGSADGEHAERFTHLRPLLFTIAYEILGSTTESDDVLQDGYLRWADAQPGQAHRVHRPTDDRSLAASIAGPCQRKTTRYAEPAPGVLRDGPVEIGIEGTR
jgi:hypothetical protein